jgi:hypothetical protein
VDVRCKEGVDRDEGGVLVEEEWFCKAWSSCWAVRLVVGGG